LVNSPSSSFTIPAAWVMIGFIMRSFPVTVLCCLLVLAGGARAQDSVEKFRLTVNQVVVPVVVTDAKGHRISGLKAEDFELREDGAPQKILSFSMGGEAVTSIPQGRETNLPPDSLATRQTYSICVDTLHSTFANFPPVRAALEKFFEKETRTDSQYLLISLGKKPEVLQYPTPDPSAVLRILRDKKFLATIQNSEAAALGAQTATLRQQLDTYCQLCPCGRNTRPAPAECFGQRQSIIGLVTTSADRTRVYTEFFLKELRAVIDDLSRMPGNRVMILISDGFNLAPGRELFGVMRAYFPNDDRWQMNDRDTSSQLEPILRVAAANNIVVYGISSSGLGLAGGANSAYQASSGGGISRQGVGQIILPELSRQASQASFESGATLAALAHATGGVFIENSNDLLAGMRRAFDETRDYYVLAYMSSNPAMDGKYRVIQVHVKDPKSVVRARAGYWAQ
jgi:VWFA-related protein